MKKLFLLIACSLILLLASSAFAITFGFYTVAPTPVPEPATMFLLGTGLIGFAGFRRWLNK